MGGLALCTGLGCATTQVSTARDPNAGFAHYRTFKLAQGHVINDGWADKRDTLVRDRIDNALQRELSAKGLESTEVNPDLIVTYTSRARNAEKLTPNYQAYSMAEVPAPFVTEYREGTLVISFIDAETDKVVWSTVAQTEGGNLRTPQSIEKAVDKALEKFPTPRSG
jgi:hypothetical protein